VKLAEKTTKHENNICFTEDEKFLAHWRCCNTPQHYYLFLIFSSILWRYIKWEISLSLFPFKLSSVCDVTIIIIIINIIIIFSCSAAQRGLWSPRSRGFLIKHNNALQSVGLLWTSDQFVAETSTRQHTTHTKQTNIHAPGGIRTHDCSRRAAVDPRPRPRDHWDRRCDYYKYRLIFIWSTNLYYFSTITLKVRTATTLQSSHIYLFIS
jgi:hypothetical protein